MSGECECNRTVGWLEWWLCVDLWFEVGMVLIMQLTRLVFRVRTVEFGFYVCFNFVKGEWNLGYDTCRFI